MVSIAGDDRVDIGEKKKEYRTEDEEEAEEDHLAPSSVPKYVPTYSCTNFNASIGDGGFLRRSFPSSQAHLDP